MTDAPYGYCPKCGGKGMIRARDMAYPSITARLKITLAMLSSPRDVTDVAKRVGKAYRRCFEPPKDVAREYGALRVALRNALYRVFGSNIPDVSPIFREIEKGMTTADATDALEAHLRELVQVERDRAQAVYKRPAR